MKMHYKAGLSKAGKVGCAQKRVHDPEVTRDRENPVYNIRSAM
jgi:hypothetical protein